MTNYLNKNSLIKGGSYGNYFKASRSVGIKVIESSGFYNFESLPYRLLSKELTVVFLEAIYFNLFYGTNFARVEVCNLDSKLFLGIKKRHLIGKNIYMQKKYSKNNKIVLKKTSVPLGLKVFKKLEEKHLFSHDMHEDNVLFNKGNIFPIDFSPDLTQYYGKKSIFVKELNSILRIFEKQYWFVKIYKQQMKKIILKQAGF